MILSSICPSVREPHLWHCTELFEHEWWLCITVTKLLLSTLPGHNCAFTINSVSGLTLHHKHRTGLVILTAQGGCFGKYALLCNYKMLQHDFRLNHCFFLSVVQNLHSQIIETHGLWNSGCTHKMWLKKWKHIMRRLKSHILYSTFLHMSQCQENHIRISSAVRLSHVRHTPWASPYQIRAHSSKYSLVEQCECLVTVCSAQIKLPEQFTFTVFNSDTIRHNTDFLGHWQVCLMWDHTESHAALQVNVKKH